MFTRHPIDIRCGIHIAKLNTVVLYHLPVVPIYILSVGGLCMPSNECSEGGELLATLITELDYL